MFSANHNAEIIACILLPTRLLWIHMHTFKDFLNMTNGNEMGMITYSLLINHSP